MKLIFIHGWGLDAQLWDAVVALLPKCNYECIDMGYFGQPLPPLNFDEPAILVGHSLGFIYGMTKRTNWQGWIAVNSFPRFVETKTQVGCVEGPVLRDIRLRLTTNPEKTLDDFHKRIGAATRLGKPDTKKLCEGLDTLRDQDVTSTAARLSPGLVLASRHDPLVPVVLSKVLAKGKDILWHENGGHMLPQTDPAFCAKAIHHFIEQHAFVSA